MTAVVPTHEFRSTSTDHTSQKTAAMFKRLFTLFAAAGRAVPFHRESRWELSGSTNFADRDRERAVNDIRAIASMREHG
ncbi:hypothetical protein JK358_36520 [Nocardia sp. 2]|uniref:Uncharacterized protein n=1 Tax=Nocardia acididurans TaxID=2802282 RepID=A0ABS1MH90_9NOCA|nr:hypothetical protein [Nocardia acididurans]MBL1079916.1 hypothetical protein [Nocardia acididurans]